jgi:hypothetical protein
MKNIIYALYISLFCSFYSVAQTTTENHVKTTAYRLSTTTSDVSKAKVSVTYYDGLGRPVQQVAGKASATGKDIITHMEYDGFGRQSRQYLPYGSGTSNLSFDTSAKANTEAFYNTAVYENTLNPYSEKFFEPSPLDRVRKEAAPGNVWLGDPLSDNDHTLKFAYQTNTTNDQVSKFTAVATWSDKNKIYEVSLISSGYYAEGQLYKNVVQNENKTAAVYTGTVTTNKSYLTEELKAVALWRMQSRCIDTTKEVEYIIPVYLGNLEVLQTRNLHLQFLIQQQQYIIVCPIYEPNDLMLGTRMLQSGKKERVSQNIRIQAL